MAKGDSGDGIFKSIIDAGKGNIDFIAFALVAALTVGALVKGLAFLPAVGIAVVLICLWVIMRYALVALQSHERLRAIRENATIEAQNKLAKYATDDDMSDLFRNHERSGGDDEL